MLCEMYCARNQTLLLLVKAQQYQAELCDSSKLAVQEKNDDLSSCL